MKKPTPASYFADMTEDQVEKVLVEFQAAWERPPFGVDELMRWHAECCECATAWAEKCRRTDARHLLRRASD
jgi:hypothetical protein